jgi:Domain of unknown function (DUF4350)
MNHRGLLFSAGALAILMFAASLWLAPNPYLQRSATTFGVARGGYKAAYELLSELGFSVSRSFERPAGRTARRTLWFVSPPFLNSSRKKYQDAAGPVMDWIRAGGVAVVFGDEHSDWKRLGLKIDTAAGGAQSVVAGEYAQAPRDIPIPKLMRFKSAPKGAAILLAADGAPFAIERKLGKGRIVAIADDRFMHNANLDLGDCSVLLVDLVRALGAPTFDEWCHGIAPPASIVEAVAGSRAILPILVGMLAAVAWAMERRSWPRRTLDDERESPAPTIATFVESLGALYSTTGDPAAVFRAYRSGFLRRMRRRISPHAEISESSLLERIARDGALHAGVRRWLVQGDAPRDSGELVIAVRAIESYPRAGS